MHLTLSIFRQLIRHLTPAPLFEIFGGFVLICIFWLFTTRIHDCTLIVAIRQCLQYVLCSLPSQQNIGYLWRGHQNEPQTLRILQRRDRAPDFEIPESVPYLYLYKMQIATILFSSKPVTSTWNSAYNNNFAILFVFNLQLPTSIQPKLSIE